VPVTLGGAVIAAYYLATRLSALSLPVFALGRRSLSHLIVAYSFLDHGLRTFLFTTYGESFGGLHVFALLSAPWVAVAGPLGMRLFAIACGGAALVVLYALVGRLYDHQRALLATALVAVSPMFRYVTVRATPEALGFLLTTASVYALVRSRDVPADADGRRWFGASLALPAVATADHFWAAYVALPLVVGALVSTRAGQGRSRRLIPAFASAATAASVVVVGRWVRDFAPREGTALIQHYSALSQTQFLSDPAFYGRLFRNAGWTLSKPLAVLALVATGYYGVRWLGSRDDGSTRAYGHALVVAWFVAGSTVVFGLPRGAWFHLYYLWVLLVPGAILATVALTDLAEWAAERLSGSVGRVGGDAVVGLAQAVAVLLVVTHVGAPALASPNAEPVADRTAADGRDLGTFVRANGVAAEEIAIVTHLPTGVKETSETNRLHSYLAYAGLYVDAPGRPSVYASRQAMRRQWRGPGTAPALVVDARDSYLGARRTEREPIVLSRGQEGGYRRVRVTESSR
jgi:hypothetical protein